MQTFNELSCAMMQNPRTFLSLTGGFAPFFYPKADPRLSWKDSCMYFDQVLASVSQPACPEYIKFQLSRQKQMLLLKLVDNCRLVLNNLEREAAAADARNTATSGAPSSPPSASSATSVSSPPPRAMPTANVDSTTDSIDFPFLTLDDIALLAPLLDAKDPMSLWGKLHELRTRLEAAAVKEQELVEKTEKEINALRDQIALPTLATSLEPNQMLPTKRRQSPVPTQLSSPVLPIESPLEPGVLPNASFDESSVEVVGNEVETGSPAEASCVPGEERWCVNPHLKIRRECRAVVVGGLGPGRKPLQYYPRADNIAPAAAELFGTAFAMHRSAPDDFFTPAEGKSQSSSAETFVIVPSARVVNHSLVWFSKSRPFDSRSQWAFVLNRLNIIERMVEKQEKLQLAMDKLKSGGSAGSQYSRFRWITQRVGLTELDRQLLQQDRLAGASSQANGAIMEDSVWVKGIPLLTKQMLMGIFEADPSLSLVALDAIRRTAAPSSSSTSLPPQQPSPPPPIDTDGAIPPSPPLVVPRAALEEWMNRSLLEDATANVALSISRLSNPSAGQEAPPPPPPQLRLLRNVGMVLVTPDGENPPHSRTVCELDAAVCLVITTLVYPPVAPQSPSATASPVATAENAMPTSSAELPPSAPAAPIAVPTLSVLAVVEVKRNPADLPFAYEQRNRLVSALNSILWKVPLTQGGRFDPNVTLKFFIDKRETSLLTAASFLEFLKDPVHRFAMMTRVREMPGSRIRNEIGETVTIGPPVPGTVRYRMIEVLGQLQGVREYHAGESTLAGSRAQGLRPVTVQEAKTLNFSLRWLWEKILRNKPIPTPLELYTELEQLKAKNTVVAVRQETQGEGFVD